MTVLDTFYLLFKSDAKQTAKDVADLDKQIAELATKGQKRSDAETKQLKDLRKLRLEQTQDIKDQQKAAEGTGQSFVNLAESAASAAAAMFSLGAIQSGIANQTKFNSNLDVQAKLWGANATQVKAFANAAEIAGGSVEGALSSIGNIFGLAKQTGQPFPDLVRYFQSTHNFIRGFNPTAAGNYLDQAGISDPGLRLKLQGSDAEFNKWIGDVVASQSSTEEADKAARDFDASLGHLHKAFKDLFDLIDTDLPLITELTEKFAHWVESLKNSKTETYGFLATIGVGALAAGGAALKGAKSLLGLGGGSAAAGMGLISRAGQAGLIYAGSRLFFEGEEDAVDWLGRRLKSPGKGEAVNADAMSFWMSKGYSRAQAAGIAANEQAESGGNPAARNGSHYGLYQWDAARAKRILDGAGIDVRTASADDQRRAASWELQQYGYADKIKSMGGADAVAAYVNDRYEVSSLDPATLAANATGRGKIALGLVDSTPIANVSNDSSSRNVNVKIDEVNVNTQATDSTGIAGAIGGDLTHHISTTMSALDDGRQM